MPGLNSLAATGCSLVTRWGQAVGGLCVTGNSRCCKAAGQVEAKDESEGGLGGTSRTSRICPTFSHTGGFHRPGFCFHIRRVG